MKRIAVFFLIAWVLPSFVSAEFGLGLPGVIKKRVERLDEKIKSQQPPPPPVQQNRAPVVANVSPS
ncbi:MAG: hypothetical protein AAB740_02350, partial [Patescibacteria group bacterium]